MAHSNEKRLDEQQRLLAMREYLRVRARPEDQAFDAEVVDAAIKKVSGLVDANSASTGERIIALVASELSIQFEDVRSEADIQTLEHKYLVERKELGFGRLAHELADPSVDALLFQRINAAQDAPDRWVAVINLQETDARAYWSRPHEIVHRLAEPPQRRLPFFRHRSDHTNRIERIIDLGAAELAFPRLAFGRRVAGVVNQELTWDLVQLLRQQFAPTSSLQAAAKATVRYWPRPVFLLKATFRGRAGDPSADRALRIDVDGFSPSAENSGVRFFTNMRVPPSSPVWHCHESKQSVTDHEGLERWTTSKGAVLPSRVALTSCLNLRSFVYGIVSLL